MKSIKLRSYQLLNIMIENRDRHIEEFNSAIKGYAEHYAEELRRMLSEVESGNLDAEWRHIPRPVSHESSYDRAIKMLELTADEYVELTEDEFDRFVMDRWDWKAGFLRATSLYNGTVASK